MRAEEKINISDIERALASVRVPASPGEYDLHGMIAKALDEANVPYRHEARLAPRCRVDFLCGDIAVEIKKDRPPRAKLLAQAQKYLSLDGVAALIIVTQRQTPMPRSLSGKPVEVISLSRLWGVALP